MVKEGKKITGPEALRESAQGSARIRGDTLGIVGLGRNSTIIGLILIRFHLYNRYLLFPYFFF